MSQAIVCFAGNLYDQRPWTNRQRIMTIFASMGHKVLYVEPPKSIIKQFAKLMLPIGREQSTGRWFTRLFKCEKRSDNLYIASLISFVPTRSSALRRLNYSLNLFFLKKIIQRLEISDHVLWIYTPDAVAAAGKTREKVLCYDCVDEYASQPFYRENFDGLVVDEDELLRKADIVFTTSRYLYEKKKKRNTNIFLVHNVGDYLHFSKAQNAHIEMPEDIRGIPGRKVGFIGAIDDYKVDFDVLSHAMMALPGISFVFIGPSGMAGGAKETEKIRSMQNAYFLGAKKYEDLPSYISHFDALIIPYRENDYTRGCFPIKFFEYLASGKPVVVHGLPELKEYRSLIEYADNRESFAAGLNKVLENDTDKRKRIDTARDHTWENKALRQISLINELTHKE